MSEPIRVGDLVVVRRPQRCCGSDRVVGLIFRVELMREISGRCNSCGARTTEMAVSNPLTGNWIAMFRLQRVPTLDELDDVKHDETIHA